MTTAVAFWVVWLVWILAGHVRLEGGRPRWRAGGPDLALALLLFLVGWRAFGFPVQG